MHVSKPTVLEKLRLSRFSATEDGMHVEVSVFSSNPAESTTVLFTFREDENLGMQVVLHGSGDIAFPLAELKAAIRYAEAEVHKESFYDSPSSQSPGYK
jgi:hypothetical protein